MNIPVRFVIIVKWNKIRFPSFLVYTIINWTMLSSRSVKHLHIKTGFCSVLYVCLYVQCESHIVYFQYFFILVFLHHFVELGGGVDDASGWCRDGAYVELGFQWRWWLTDMTVFLIVCSSDSWFSFFVWIVSSFHYDNYVLHSPPWCFEISQIWVITG